jgi:hypothetical protein
MARIKVLKENVRHHVNEEEGRLFKLARTVLTIEDAERMAVDFDKAKARHKKALRAEGKPNDREVHAEA